MKNLIIVESPAKAGTIEKYLGKDYKVLASYGHIRDLVAKNGAVETDNDFLMHYEIVEKNEKHLKDIVSALKKAEVLYLATDPDREGEAISWHLYEILNNMGALKNKKVYRIAFHEITKTAISQALENPREISMNLVNAQQARRALDYLVGFNLSPLLWKKVQRGLSAGRVQSPALKMIVDREREIDAFVAREYWSIEANLEKEGQNFTAALNLYQGQKVSKFTIENEEQASSWLKDLENQAQGVLRVLDKKVKEQKRNPSAPFITSTLQQEAANKLHFPAQRTMRAAQKLYEEGHITYMRTDSVNLASEALDKIRENISQNYGADYLPKEIVKYTTKSKNAQEAHEAIRPTDIFVEVSGLSAKMGADEKKIYELIRKRTLACQMNPAVLEQTTISFAVGSEDKQMTATGSVIKFSGFMEVYLEAEEEEKELLLPALKEGEEVKVKKFIKDQHFTQPPARYSEAGLIKYLEECGIGRPSTYASIVSTLETRGYVEIEQRRFKPTAIGNIVNDFLANHFATYVDYGFTAQMEDELDEISRGEKEWKPLLNEFWQGFKQNIEEKAGISRADVMQSRELGNDPNSGKPVFVKIGNYGPYVQKGEYIEDEKPEFVSIPKEMDMQKITLEQALSLFTLPRILGETEEDGEISTNIGRFGPYVKYGKKYVSLPKDESPFTIDFEKALDLIAAKKKQEAEKYIKEIPYGAGVLQVLNGRFGPYVSNGDLNASIPKKLDPKELSLEQALELLEKAKDRKAKKAGEKTTSSKKTSKKSTSKKAKT